MYLLEHDAKELLARYGIAVPPGRLVDPEDTLDRLTLPAGPWMVKGQVAAGGRGKAGIIKRSETPKEVADHARAIFEVAVKGRAVESVRIEQQVPAAREIYVGFLLDAAAGGVRAILSASGGMDIEQAPRDRILSDLAPADTHALADCMDRL